MSFPYFVSALQEPRERGFHFGSELCERVTWTVSAYRRFLTEAREATTADIERFGEKILAGLWLSYPELADEIEGIAAGAGVSAVELAAINGRTEFLAGRFRTECSGVGAVIPGTEGTSCYLAQNWDWHPDWASSLVVWTVTQPDGRSFTTLTEAGILGKIGLNTDHLACGLILLGAAEDGGDPGMPIHVLLRIVLDRCTTLSEALEVLLNARVSASSCILLAYSGAGQSAVLGVELSPSRTEIVSSDTPWFVHTSHFMSPQLRAGDLSARWPDTYTKLFDLRTRAAAQDGTTAPSDAIGEMLRSHFNHPRSVCEHRSPEDQPWIEQSSTVASVIMHVDALRMAVAHGQPCEVPYQAIDVSTVADVVTEVG